MKHQINHVWQQDPGLCISPTTVAPKVLSRRPNRGPYPIVPQWMHTRSSPPTGRAQCGHQRIHSIWLYGKFGNRDESKMNIRLRNLQWLKRDFFFAANPTLEGPEPPYVQHPLFPYTASGETSWFKWEERTCSKYYKSKNPTELSPQLPGEEEKFLLRLKLFQKKKKERSSQTPLNYQSHNNTVIIHDCKMPNPWSTRPISPRGCKQRPAYLSYRKIPWRFPAAEIMVAQWIRNCIMAYYALENLPRPDKKRGILHRQNTANQWAGLAWKGTNSRSPRWL